MELFIQEPELSFDPLQKVAMVQLDEDPSSWARKILTELFRQVPETSEYSPQVMFAKTDKEQGYGLGVILITSATDSALSAVRPGSSAKKVYVPILVKNHMLCPLDLLMSSTGKMMPLTGQRLRQGLFRPETFEMVTDDWGDSTLYNMFYPPGRSSNDFGSGLSQGSGAGITTIQGSGMKQAGAAEFPLLDVLAPTMLGPDLAAIGALIEATPGLVEKVSSNHAFLAALKKLAAAEQEEDPDPTALQKTAAASVVGTHVRQVGYSELHESYWVKSASRSAFYHEDPVFLGRSYALRKLGEAVIHKVDTDGTVTIAAESTDASDVPLEGSSWSVIETPGIYKVKTVQGKELTGWVLPDLVALDGTHVPMAVFTNGSQAMVQGQILGARVAEGVDLPAAAAKGTGVFYCSGPNGVIATVPLVVSGKEVEDGGSSYLVHSLTGEESRVRLVPGIKGLQALGKEFHMPDTAKFLPLNDEHMVALVERPDGLSKTSAAHLEPHIRLVAGDHHEITLRFANMPKLASQFPSRMDHETAVFALCSAGLSPQVAHTKMAAARNGEPVWVRGISDVRLMSDIVEEARKVASRQSTEVMSLRQSLIKEAATLPDVMSIDGVLSLGFINSENVRMFVSRVPYLEKVLNQLCELMLASRLGLNEIPEHATARCVRAMEETIQGLRALSLRDASEGGVRSA